MRNFFIIIIFFGSIALNNIAHAETLGVAVSPSFVEMTVTSESQNNGSIALKNTSDSIQELQVSGGTFDIDNTGKTYLVDVHSDDVFVDVRFVQLRIELNAGETQQIDYVIDSAENAPDGTYTLAAIIETVCNEETTKTMVGVCVRARVGVPFLVTVDNGKLSHDATVEFGGSSFVTFAPTSHIVADVYNAGTSAIRPQSSVVMSSVFGREITRADSAPQYIVLPDRTRTFDFYLAHPDAFGLYRFSAHMSDGDAGVHQSVWWAFVLSRTQFLWTIVIALGGFGGWYMWYRRVWSREKK